MDKAQLIDLMEEALAKLCAFLSNRDDLTNEEKVHLSRVGFALGQAKSEFQQ